MLGKITIDIHEVTPSLVPVAVRITLFFTKSQAFFQKHKELAQKYQALLYIIVKCFSDNTGHFRGNCLYFWDHTW